MVTALIRNLDGSPEEKPSIGGEAQTEPRSIPAADAIGKEAQRLASFRLRGDCFAHRVGGRDDGPTEFRKRRRREVGAQHVQEGEERKKADKLKGNVARSEQLDHHAFLGFLAPLCDGLREDRCTRTVKERPETVNVLVEGNQGRMRPGGSPGCFR
jgi:hypothetical protein